MHFAEIWNASKQGCARLMSRESKFDSDSDSNESSQSRVGRENQGYESSHADRHLSQSWVN